MRDHLKSIVDMATNIIPPITQKHLINVLDIAANDGTLLSYYPSCYRKYAVDPSSVVCSIKDPSVTVIKDFFPTEKLKNIKFDIITSIAVLYDLENPETFIDNIRHILSDNGIWIFEMSYLPTMLQMNAFDTVCGEHIFYYSLSVIESLLETCGMKLIDATLNDINGGSVQCVAVKKRCNNFCISHENINKLRNLEFDMALDDITPYNEFADRTYSILNNLLRMIHYIKANGKTVHLYGASTKVNTLLQAARIDNNLIPYAAERNADKFGAHTLGTNIEIISEEESRKMKPDYYLVGPWHFKTEILEREKDAIASGTKFIFPLPNLEIYPPEK